MRSHHTTTANTIVTTSAIDRTKLPNVHVVDINLVELPLAKNMIKLHFDQDYTSTKPIREERGPHSGAISRPTADVQPYMYDTAVRQQLA